MSLHTLIFGLGATGQSCLRYLHGQDRITVVDTRSEPPGLDDLRTVYPEARYYCGALPDGVYAGVDRILVSPGIALDHPWLAEAWAAGITLSGDVALFLSVCNAPVIGITGTNGKSTVATLTAELLRAAGFNVAVGGNLGPPALDLLAADAEIYVLELSSFQLERLADKTLALGAVLNVSSDHMDRYPDLASYAACKQRIYQGARVAVFNRADPLTEPPDSVSIRISVGLDQPPGDEDWGILDDDGESWLCRGEEQILSLEQLAMTGRHNEFNAMAALALAAAAGADPRRGAELLRTFPGLPHRCELVRKRGGVRYINDSKATNVGAAVAALQGLGDPAHRSIVLIAGGDAKQADLTPLREPVRRWVRELVLLGRDAPLLEQTLGDLCPVHKVADMDEAVALAASLAASGDLVLLSPACASLDMYTNFEARGQAFADAVNALEVA